MEAVNSKVDIRVGLLDVDMDTLREKHGPVKVEQTLRADTDPHGRKPYRRLTDLQQVLPTAGCS